MRASQMRESIFVIQNMMWSISKPCGMISVAGNPYIQHFRQVRSIKPWLYDLSALTTWRDWLGPNVSMVE